MFDLFHNLKCGMTHQKRAKLKRKKKHVQNKLSSRGETSGLKHVLHFITNMQILLEFETKLPMSTMVIMVIPAAAKQNCPRDLDRKLEAST